MGHIQCCGALRKTRTFLMKLDENTFSKQLDLLEVCPVCGNKILQLTKVNSKEEVSIYRLRNKKAEKFLEKCKFDILYEENEISVPKYYGKFYLNYNEYGVKKRCYSNLSTLKIGLYENK